MIGDRWLVLDAMGVIYQAGDDVADVLVPFLRRNGSTLDDGEVADLYHRASLGQLRSTEFWRACGLEPCDEEYVIGHELNPGLFQLIDAAKAKDWRVACLSNDVSEWSRELRRRFALDDHISHWVISGDIGARKPDDAAYHALLTALDTTAANCLFVDDRSKNTHAAEALGIASILMGSESHPSLLAIEQYLA